MGLKTEIGDRAGGLEVLGIWLNHALLKERPRAESNSRHQDPEAFPLGSTMPFSHKKTRKKTRSCSNRGTVNLMFLNPNTERLLRVGAIDLVVDIGRRILEEDPTLSASELLDRIEASAPEKPAEEDRPS